MIRRTRCTSLAFAATLLISNFCTASDPELSEAGLSEAGRSEIASGGLVQRVLHQRCLQCHGDQDTIEGDVNLTQPTLQDLPQNVELLRDLVGVIDRNEMPPEDEPQLEKSTRSQLLAELRKMLHAATSGRSQGKTTPIRRMNRFQYNNAVIDLFDLRCIVFTLPERTMREHQGYFKPASGEMAKTVSVGNRALGKSQMIENRLSGVAAFPQDLRAEHGFDNRADHLSLSPLLMESFLKLGESITQSPDFTERNVGIWSEFFASPVANAKPVKAPGDLVTEVTSRLRSFLKRAFRRPVPEELLQRYTSFTLKQIESGASFTEAMKTVAAATISSPRFLYLYETSHETQSHETQSHDFALASRLSFFLWGSIPDQTLFDLAENGTLRDPVVLEKQIQRMLQDRKIKRFCDSFPIQWLQLDRLVSSVPDQERFPQFYFLKYRVSMHMMLEPLLLFETVLIENQPITQLIDPDFTYRSKLLDKAYGELAGDRGLRGGGGVGVLNFERVPVTDRRTGGIITNAAVMTMTSGPERTQPITRGAWVATVVFNDPPDPPPADVPTLEEKPPEAEQQLTLRERLALHRERNDCRGCHEQIDPLGFALENFDPIGRWRDQYANGRNVDSEGTLFRQHDFINVVEFKNSILAEKDRFTRALGGHLLSFALARELGPSDEIALDEIVSVTREDNERMKTLLMAVIMSRPFLDQPHVSDPSTITQVNP